MYVIEIQKYDIIIIIIMIDNNEDRKVLLLFFLFKWLPYSFEYNIYVIHISIGNFFCKILPKR